MERDTPGFDAVIPAYVRYSDISSSAKLLYGEIRALCSKEGYCWATNKYFSELYKVTPRSITDWISELVEKKFVGVEENFQGGRRILLGGVEENFHTLLIQSSNTNKGGGISPSGETSLEDIKKKKPKTPREFTNQRRKELGKPPLRTPRTENQEKALRVLRWKDYFKEQGYEQHGMQFFLVESKKREAAVTRLITTADQALGDEVKDLIDWWLSGAGDWAEYEPEQCFMGRTIDRFRNRDKGKREESGGINLNEEESETDEERWEKEKIRMMNEFEERESKFNKK